MPKTLSQCDEVEINEVTFVNVLDRMSRHAVDDPCTLTNPNYPSVQDVKGLYTPCILRRLIAFPLRFLNG